MDSTETMNSEVEVWKTCVPEMTCDSCSQVESGQPLKQCSACHLVWYCDATCQRNHWKYHKSDCQRVTERKGSTDPASVIFQSGLGSSSIRFLARSSSSPSKDILALLKDAVLLLERAEMKQPPLSKEDRMELFSKASQKVKKIFAIDPDHSQALFLEAQIYLLRGELNAGIVALEALLDPQFGPPMITDDEDKIMILVLIGKAYMKMRNFNAAMQVYGQAYDVFENACKCCMKSSNQKLILSGISQCSYELGNYEEAVDSGLKAIWFNRHYNEGYEFVIKAYKQLGKWDMALSWMKRACRYEAPWNEDIVKRNKQLSEELMAARDQALAKAVKVKSGNSAGGSSSSSSSSSCSSSYYRRARHRTAMVSTLDL